jgi:hypothetical protein
MDGEYVGTTPDTFQVVPGALRVLVPRHPIPSLSDGDGARDVARPVATRP